MTDPPEDADPPGWCGPVLAATSFAAVVAWVVVKVLGP